jgi:hypothetical protein
METLPGEKGQLIILYFNQFGTEMTARSRLDH